MCDKNIGIGCCSRLALVKKKEIYFFLTKTKYLTYYDCNNTFYYAYLT